MRIYFVRHGHPDYALDCLTPLGHKQAAAAAERLRGRGIEQIFSSTKGRALQTAEHTARALGLPVIPCDFMQEIAWGSADGAPIPEGGHPWRLADGFAEEGRSLRDEDWYTRAPFSQRLLVGSVRQVSEKLDEWLSSLGYDREGDGYRVTGERTDRTVAMFSHAGSSSAALSHLFHIPFPQICGMLRIDFTGVTVVDFVGEKGRRVQPRLVCFDASHIVGIE